MRALIWGRFRRNPLAMFGIAILGIFALAAILAPVVAPYDPNAVDPYDALQGPSADHWAGTDDLGRDVFSRLVYAGRVSMLVGLFASIIAVAIGAVLGAVAGYYGRLVDSLISRANSPSTLTVSVGFQYSLASADRPLSEPRRLSR